jgi:hypothetical protein
VRTLTNEEYEFTHAVAIKSNDIYKLTNKWASKLFIGENQKHILYSLPDECFTHDFSLEESKVISKYYNLEIIHVDRLNFFEVM